MVTVPEEFTALERLDSELADTAEPAPEVCRALGDEALGVLAQKLTTDNLDLRAAAARLRQAEAIAREAGAPLWPRVDAALPATRSNSLGLGAALGGLGGGGGFPLSQLDTGPSTSYQPSLAASYEIDLWGKLRDRQKAAALDAVASSETLRSLKVTLTAQLAETWINLLAQRRLIDLLESQIEVSERFLELARLRFGLGQGAAPDIGRQRQQTEALRGQLELARGREATLEGQLAVLAGHAPTEFSAPDGRALPELPELPAPGLPLRVVEARPDLRAALARLEAADRRLAAQAKDWLPSLSLSANVFSFASVLKDLFDNVLWQVAGRVAETVTDGGGRAARLAAADARAEEQLQLYGQSLLQALQEVRTALLANASQAEFAASLEIQLEEARRVLDLIRTGYREGATAYLDVLVSLQSLQGLERQEIEAARQQFVNRVQLCRALGFPVAADSSPLHLSSTPQTTTQLAASEGLHPEER